MPITADDIQFRLSTKVGSQGNSGPSTPNNSLGKYVATTQVVDAQINNLFDDVSGTENQNLVVDYRCLFVYNAHPSLDYQNVVAWIDSQVAGGADIAIAVDTTSQSAVNAAQAQALEIANETTPPAGLTFQTTPVSRATGLSLGTISSGSVKAVWVRRTATNSAAMSNDGAVLAVSGDTAA